MEAHLVHYNEKYGNFERAVTKKDGLAVVALFIQAMGDRDCDFFRKITDQIDKIRQPNAKCELQSGKIHLSELFPLDLLESFIRILELFIQILKLFIQIDSTYGYEIKRHKTLIKPFFPTQFMHFQTVWSG